MTTAQSSSTTRHPHETGRCHTIVPPYILERLTSYPDPEVAARAREALLEKPHERRLTAKRGGQLPKATPKLAPGTISGGPVRLISDTHNTSTLPGAKVRGEGDPATDDVAVTEGYDGLGATWTLYADAYDRNSLDGKGLPLRATVHYGQNYDNAFWDGTQMVFGDGDGKVFGRFTASLDVIGHELTHGVTEHTAGLMYQGQPGALNESMSDVFGSLVKQRELGQSATEADWLIGAELLIGPLAGQALRSMIRPGTAYDNDVLGKDPQPDNMSGYVETDEDNGGVHINSGIPNRAFALAAIAIGGNAWEAAGTIWYSVLTGDAIAADCDFATFAGLTVAVAEQRYGADSPELAAVKSGWDTVGVVPVVPVGAAGDPQTPAPDTDSDPAPQTPDPAPAPAPGDPEPAPGEPAPAPGEPAPAPPPGQELQVKRSGGLIGRTVSKTVALDRLPKQDERQWRSVLSTNTLQALSNQPPTRSDSFCYGVSCTEPYVEVQIDEQHLPEDLRDLFERTLRDD